ncbi:hypothetical protein LMB76_04030 [Limosilactobacillus reuteri]|uniref:Uncharacterized protein n=2 Tax=Limosilactobacillus reuteri TaxID=1598 RepID=B3XQ48_LIMR1|nr:hypothetical protein [Limosilactobacillus reuteri]EDX41649.1 hypothetical protein Lreu23DRAFT_3160 [Limosilactobacillus reuteri subsp. rodentium]MCC4475340.1 hypothetical protein [Limosilactobacillus reuteri]MCC4477387.1 hypothetical protein [Limosilactobacillus reuteri]MCC4479664.1 hypothetical protein [Limosilactobacillus reuteri]MCC4489030.1 hypothetical protein [Limosilactobacillus reuteri]
MFDSEPAGAVELVAELAGAVLTTALDAGLLSLLASDLVSPPVLGVDGVVFFPSSPDGEIILTLKQLLNGMH